MGMDLDLMPFDHFWANLHREYWGTDKPIHLITTNRLSTVREYRFYAQISKEVMGDEYDVKVVCDPKPIPKSLIVHVYEDEGIKIRKMDPYGDKLTYVTAGDLSKAKSESAWNQGILTFIKTLPEDMPVILWWH